MARHLAATRDGGRATFLLEVALDRAQTKTRLAAALAAERARRGGGDARRFPQPQMAQLLGYSLRQYQRLEDPEDPSLPGWNDLERITGTLGIESDSIFSDAASQPPSNGIETGGAQQWQRELADEIRRGFREINEKLDLLSEQQRATAAARPR